MSQLRVAPIVEGHGDVTAIPILLRRIWSELIQGEYLDVLQPVRVARTKLVRRQAAPEQAPTVDKAQFARALRLAKLKLLARYAPAMPALVLVVLDANSDCPAQLAPQLCAPDLAEPVACVLAKVEYESWFVAAAESLSEHLDLQNNPPPADPEGSGSGKQWIKTRFRGARYSETVDQPSMTAKMDLVECRSRSPSFDKLCRELEKRRTHT